MLVSNPARLYRGPDAPIIFACHCTLLIISWREILQCGKHDILFWRLGNPPTLKVPGTLAIWTLRGRLVDQSSVPFFGFKIASASALESRHGEAAFL